MTPSLKTLIFLAATTATGWCEADIAGTFSLTSDIPVVVARSGSGWTLQIGKEAPHPLLPGTANHWSVPDLGLGVACPSGGGLELTRYGKTVLAPPAQAGKQPNPAGRPDEAILDDLVPRLMIAWNVPGVSAVGIREGSIAWRRQYGVKTFGQPAPVDENTVFEACSMSKPVFAYAALKLVEEGKLDLDTPLVQYLGHPYIENEPLHQKITTRMVLDHTSGLPNWRPGGRNSGQPLVVHFEPGTKFQYSGEGIWFLQRTVEKITGVPLKDWMKSRLLDPLGMTSSSYTWEKKFEATAAAGHDKAGQVHLNRPLYREGNAAFSLYTTPADYAKVLLEVMNPDRSAPYSLGPKILKEMLTPQSKVPANDAAEGGDSKPLHGHFRGLGWAIDETATGDRYFHGGSNGTGFRCYAEFDPKVRGGFVLMTNAENGTEVWRAVAAAISKP